MSLKEQIIADVKSAMKNKEADLLLTLRFIHAEIKNREIDMRPQQLSDDDVVGVLKKLAKQRKDSMVQFKSANREDLVLKEQQELTIIEKYLPEQLSPDKIATFVEEAIQETQAQSIKDMGRVMKVVMEKAKGAADNKVISDIVKSKLQ
ncbi:MAG: GatB/YqeY domain-containing protein [Bdellovibrionaceae bacterium]|nr:GatB/YqeY domain-containing protein [Pseudobdellovibrionaceae bacterium]